MDLSIKNMVCDRCLKTVTAILKETGVEVQSVQLGKAIIGDGLTPEQLQILRKKLEAEGFELLDNHKAKLVQEIKQLIIDLVHYGELDEMKVNLSGYLAGRLHKDYHYLTNLFSSVENNTIEQYFILQKIEKVKEWLVYDELTLSEMAFKLGYSSVAYLSGQFKKITGFTTSDFKKLKDHHRRAIDKI